MSNASSWQVQIKSGVRVCVAPNIGLMTGYILLEQEDWFEDEMDFIRALTTPEMNSFDIGANHGVYGLTIASQLAGGHVWAFEPTLAPGGRMQESIALNGLAGRITWVHAGLSDHDGSAEISISGNSETNSLHGASGQTERITLHALDAFIAREGIDAAIDFVKLDAEGEEIKILAGGQRFFSGQSPLVMFELKHGMQVNHGLIEGFEALGYDIYRLAPGLGMLVPYHSSFIDGFLLNLFACKPDRAQQIAERGLLARQEPLHAEPPAIDWRQKLFALPCAAPYDGVWRFAPLPSTDHEIALSACLMALDGSTPAATRLSAATGALARVAATTSAGKGDVALWLLRLNLTHLLGERAVSVGIARKLAGLPPATLATLQSPFLPPSEEFHHRDLGPKFEFLPAMLHEFIEYRRSHSTYYENDPLDPLSALAAQPGHGIELDRRLILMARRHGQRLNISADHPLFQPATSPNWQIWREIAGL